MSALPNDLVMSQDGPLTSACEICGSPVGTMHLVKEMMFGTREEFQYRECTLCGCLSEVEVPADLSRFYPDQYYSMLETRTNALRKLRDRIYLSPLSMLVNWRRRPEFDVIRRCKVTKNHRILDVGSGTGHLLQDLRELGYQAEGLDPFITRDVRDRFGVRVWRKTIEEISGQYDVVLFQHSLEHMPRQLAVLQAARKLLAPTGVCVISVPVVGWAWRHYGVNWGQLDAPRHLFLHTRKSMCLVALQAGFRIERVVYDSTDFQFWLSEFYRRGIPLRCCTRPNWIKTLRMRRRAALLNRAEDGDQAQFYLRPASN
jgi:2-polyprenyl-3-methyl-5-hydroxy-6-metoxy-1,4-benzoquinol methylase